MKSYQLAKARKKINAQDHIVLTAHTNPDGDAIGSVCAMLLALKRANKNARAFLEPFHEKYLNIPGADLVETDISAYDGGAPGLVIALDCAEKNRLSKGMAQLFDQADDTLNIDHHKSNSGYAKMNIIDENASATAELVYELLANDGMNREIASALYTGIITDTGCFRHPSTTPHTHYIASKLLSFQIPFGNIIKQQFYARQEAEAKLLGLSIGSMESFQNGRIKLASLTQNQIHQVHGEISQLDGIVEYIKNIDGTVVSVFLYENGEGKIKGSFRSEGEIDVSVFCSRYGGGGHKNASGALLDMPMEMAKKTVVDDLIQFLS